MIKFRKLFSCIIIMLLLLSCAGYEFLSACGLSGLFCANLAYAESEGDNEEESEIESIVVENYTDIVVFLGETPQEIPTALEVNLTRTINGVPDEEFEWQGGASEWYSEHNALKILYIPYVPGAEYIVTDKNDELPLDIISYTQFDYSNIFIKPYDLPDYPNSEISSVERLVNNSVDDSMGSYEVSVYKMNDEPVISIYRIGLGDSYSAGSTIQYKVTYNDKVYYTVPFTLDNGVQLSPLKINYIKKKDCVNAEIVITEVPEGYRPKALSVDIKRFINNNPDTSFEWHGGTSSWDESQKELTIYELDVIPGASYEITDKNDEYELVLGEILFKETETVEILYNRWTGRPDNLYIMREVNGETDPFSYWESTSHVLFISRIYNIEPVQPIASAQEVVYYSGFGDSEHMATYSYTVPADPAYNELSISLSIDSYTLVLGEGTLLEAYITPDELQNKSVTWSVYQQSAENVVTVTNSGVISGNKPGTATVRATSNGNKAKYADCEITVISHIYREKIYTDLDALKIGYTSGDSASAVKQDLDLTVTGAVYGSSISWESSNEQVIRISGNKGYVTRPSYEEGDKNVILTATITNNNISCKGIFHLIVLAKEKESTYTPPESPSAPSSPGIPKATPTPTPPAGAEIEAGENMVKAKITAEVKKDADGSGIAQVTEDQIKAAVAKSIAEAQGKGDDYAANVEIIVTAPEGTSEISTTIPETAVQEVADKGINALTISTSVADITFDKDAISTITGQTDGDVKITAGKIDINTLDESIKQTIGDRPVFNFSVTSGDKTISEFGGSVEISVPYTPKDGEDTDAIVIYYINADGELEVISNCLYDPVTGTVKFKTDHFSRYAVGYNKVSFADVPEDAPYSKAVNFVAARGITLGTGNGNFSPDVKLTRAQLLVMIMRAYGIRPDEDIKDNFEDAGDAYYTGYLAAAKRLGISNGVGNNKFAPDLEISKQEMVTLIYNILKLLNELPVDSGQSMEFIDFVAGNSSIASWAKEAMLVFMQNGYVNGVEYDLEPAEIATRAQMAQVMYEVLTK